MTVYAISEGFSPAVKIGYTASDPQSRLAQMETGNSSRLILLASDENLGREEEKDIHSEIREARIKGEWFWLRCFGRMRDLCREAAESSESAMGLYSALSVFGDLECQLSEQLFDDFGSDYAAGHIGGANIVGKDKRFFLLLSREECVFWRDFLSREYEWTLHSKLNTLSIDMATEVARRYALPSVFELAS